MAKKITKDEIFIDELVEELTYISTTMKNEENLEKKVYYYSAAFGITSRTYRYSFSKEVLLLDVIFSTSYRMLIERINLIKQGDMLVNPDVFMNAIKSIEVQLDDLSKNLKDKKPIYTNLENILVAAYSTTGNGNYLLEKGHYELDS